MAEEMIDAPADAGNPSDTTDAVDAKVTDTDKPLAAGGGDDKPVAAPADWPEDWRTKMSGEDKDAQKVLERYKSPADVAKALREAQKKISSGQTKPVLPDGATEEQIAAFRKELGVPEKPEGYLDALPNGLVIGDADKPIAESFLASAHEANMPPEFVGKALDWYYKMQEDQVAARAHAVKEARKNSHDELVGEWGAEFRSNINSIQAFLDTAPTLDDGTPFKNVLMGATLEDGSLMGDNPNFLRWLADLASQANPAGFVSPGTGTSQIDSLETERDAMQKRMREDPTWSKDSKAHARYEQVANALSKMKG